MLTLDMVRARTRKGELRPQYVDPEDEEILELANDLIDLFRFHIGRPYGELKDAVRAVLGVGKNAEVGRGLIKLLEDRSTIVIDSPLDPREVRRRLFEAAAEHHPVSPNPDWHGYSRDAVIEEVAAAMGADPEVVEAAMYADLPEAYVVQEARLPEPRWLLERYNVALVQAMLLRASAVRILMVGNSPARYRQLFRYIKFFRLMHQISPHPQGGFQIRLDGPLSLFKHNHKYGLQFAEFLPALLLCDGWALEAEVEWGPRRELKPLRITPADGLLSHYPDTGAYEIREEQWLRERWAQLKLDWQLEQETRLIDLGGQLVLVPDLAIRHPDGRVAWLEIIGFWRRNYLERRLDLYRRYGPGNLILAVSKQLQGSVEGLDGFGGEVYIFREVLIPRDLVEIAERIAVVEPPVEPEPAYLEPPAKGRRAGARKKAAKREETKKPEAP